MSRMGIESVGLKWCRIGLVRPGRGGYISEISNRRALDPAM